MLLGQGFRLNLGCLVDFWKCPQISSHVTKQHTQHWSVQFKHALRQSSLCQQKQMAIVRPTEARTPHTRSVVRLMCVAGHANPGATHWFPQHLPPGLQQRPLQHVDPAKQHWSPQRASPAWHSRAASPPESAAITMATPSRNHAVRMLDSA